MKHRLMQNFYFIIIFVLLNITGCQGNEANPSKGEGIQLPSTSQSSQQHDTEQIPQAEAAPPINSQAIQTEPEKHSEPSKPASIPAKATDKQTKSKLPKGKVICIDAGHGYSKRVFKPEPVAPGSSIMKSGVDTGTRGIISKVPEYKLNLSVSSKLKSKLTQHGFTVVMTRDSNTQDLSNVERAKVANSSHADLFIRIHADGSDNPSAKGISVLYPGNQYIKDKTMLSNSKKAAGLVLQNLISSTGAVSRGTVARNDLTGFNWSQVPSILVEIGFMTNKEEDQKMNTEEYQYKIVSGIVNGTLKYFEK